MTLSLYAEDNYTNALIKENSPYLQQHAHNPVNWYPWGKEAFAKAKKENKLIFLSIGYSTCHWCHVMEEKSFTDVEVAKLLNDSFVSIKVDREEYPQLDKKYQKLYMDIHGKRGGWPLSIFLSSLGEVFHLATYIPKEEGYGSQGMMNILSSFATSQETNTTQIVQRVIAYQNAREKNNKIKIMIEKFNTKMMDKVVTQIAKTFDIKNGGFTSRPKFPEASKLELLLDISKLSDNKKAFEMAELTLKEMAKGGIYDQIGGGFFRYTTDHAWQIPHFEKMLYTNAELISVYVNLYDMTGKKLYKKVVEESIAQLEKNYMQKGAYFSASDADSDGKEGGYFIYEYIEVKNALKEKGWNTQEIEDVLTYMGIEEDGNIDGDFSQPHISSEKVPERLEAFKNYLREVNNKRTFPFVDKKINTAWNSMMIKALFSASRIDKKYLILAQRRLESLLLRMYVNQTLYHQALLEKVPTQEALLEDYAFLVDALIVGYERSYDEAYVRFAQILTDEAINKFYRDKRWYLSDDGIKVEADFDDRYYTSALSMMLENLVRMATFTEKLKYNTIVKETITSIGAVLEKNPASASKLVQTFLRLNMGDIIIHAKKEKLLIAQPELDKVAYPFLLSAVQESDEYLACKTTMCFAHDKNIIKLIENIDKAVK